MNTIRKNIYKVLHPVLGEIWCLHRVLPQRSMMPENRELEITPEYFEELIIQYKKNGFEFCALNDIEYSRLSRRRWKYQKKFINISFDDGFQDIYTYAYPILKKHHIPFTIYLTTDFPNQKALIWWIALEDIIMKNEELKLNTGERYICIDIQSKIELFSLMLKRIYDSIQKPLDMFLNLFGNYINAGQNTNKELALTWEQVQKMNREGLCTIGSHSVSHPDLRKATDAELLYELTESKKIIEARINKPVIHFSYPHSCWSQEIEDAVKKTGFKTATMGFGGSVRWQANKHKLQRKYIVQS